MNRFVLKSLAALFTIATLSSCSKKEEKPEFIPNFGSLEAQVREIYQEKNLYFYCDIAIRDEIIALAHEVDSNSKAVDAGVEESINEIHASHQTLKVGDYEFAVFKEEKSKDGPWTTSRKSWNQLLLSRKRMRASGKEPNWNAYDVRIRSILMDDRRRILGGYHEGIDRKSVAALLSTNKKFQECVQSDSCSPNLPDLTEEEKKVLNSGLTYESGLKKHSRLEGDERKEQLNKLAKWLALDVEIYSFKRNPKIKQVKPGVFEFPMDLSALSEDLAGFVTAFLVPWTGQLGEIKASFEIKHISQANDADVFKLDLSGTRISRAGVSYNKKTVYLPPIRSVQTTAHELGHVIGFPDRYYTSWDDSRCEYLVEFNDDDLMSNSSTGSVSPDDWQTLNKEYPLQNQ